MAVSKLPIAVITATAGVTRLFRINIGSSNCQAASLTAQLSRHLPGNGKCIRYMRVRASPRRSRCVRLRLRQHVLSIQIGEL